MAKPWEKYKPQPTQPAGQPWNKYAQQGMHSEANQIKSDEGVKDVSYLDSKGLLTGGIGNLLHNTPLAQKYPEGTKIPQQEIDAWFQEDVKTAVEDVNALFKGTQLPPEIEGVLVNMAFQMGRNRLAGFKNMVNAVKKGDWNEMAKEMLDSEWARKDSPNRANRLHARVLQYAKDSGTSDGTDGESQ